MNSEPFTPSASRDRALLRRGAWKALLALALAIIVPACGTSSASPKGPFITGLSPQGTNVGRQLAIYIDWDRALDISTWPTSFTLTDNLGALVSSTVSFNSVNNEITLKPNSLLAGGVTYTITVLDTLKSTDGNTFAGAAFQFTTQAATATNVGQPTFSGLTGATAPPNPPGPGGTINLTWATATDAPDGSSIDYDVYLSTVSNGQDFASPPFMSTSNATGVSISGLASPGVTFYFVVRARETATGNIEFNTVQFSATTN